MLFYVFVFSGLLLFGSISCESNLDNVILGKLQDMESRLMQQEARMAKQQTELMKQQSKLAEQDARLVEQEMTLVEQQSKLKQQQTELVEQKMIVVQQESRLKEQETRLKEQETRLDEQEQVNANQQRLIDQQHRIMKQQQQAIRRLETENRQLKDAVKNLDERLTNLDSNRCEDCDREMINNSTRNLQHTRNVKPSLGVRQQPERVAFTAYLDHDLTHLGVNHPVVYNQVLLNEGSAYHPTTGIFICPMDGLYVFYFSIATNGVKQDVAKLVVEGKNQVDAVSDTFHAGHDAHGANLAVISLRQGQEVWVATYHGSDQTIHSGYDYRFSTFSGFMLY